MVESWTKLRKHIATTCISLNLEEQEVSDLQRFMRHAETIRKNIYCQPVSREILQMSIILEVAQESNDISKNEKQTSDSETSQKKKDQLSLTLSLFFSTTNGYVYCYYYKVIPCLPFS